MSEDLKVVTLESRIDDLEHELTKVRDELSKARMEQWQGRIDDLEVQAHLGSMEMSERLAPIVDTLRDRWADAKEQIETASTTANDVFETLRKGCEQSFSDFKEAVVSAKSTIAS